MSTFFGTIDGLTKKLGPVNILISKLSERLLPSEVAQASGYGYYKCGTTPCGRGKIYNDRLLCLHVVGDPSSSDTCTYYDCSC